MARVLMVGLDPARVDYSDPAFPPDQTAETVLRGIATSLGALRAAGHDATRLEIPPDPDRLGGLAGALARDRVDCVMIGGGVRLSPRNLVLFEAVLNTIAASSPAPAIALVALPEEALEAVGRALGRRSRPSPPGP